MSYHNALDTKEHWKQHIGHKAGRAENFLWELARYSHGKCDICGTGAQGMETHIVGANHYKRIGARFNWRLPPLEEAEDLNKPWVERFQTPKGPFFFNHVTGTHGFVEEAGETPVPPESSSAAAAYEPPTAAAPASSCAAAAAATDNSASCAAPDVQVQVQEPREADPQVPTPAYKEPSNMQKCQIQETALGAGVAPCSGKGEQCPHCKKFFCPYHFPVNMDDGMFSFGGHACPAFLPK